LMLDYRGRLVSHGIWFLRIDIDVMKTIFQSFALAALGLVLATGCGTPSPKAISIDIVPKTTSTVPVELVGVTDEKFDTFMGLDVDSYWSPDYAARLAADRFEIQVSDGKAAPDELSRTNAIWAKWFGGGVTHLVIFSDLRGHDFKGLGRLDPRRTDINLKDRYPKNKVVMEVQDQAVKIITPKKH